MPPESVIRQVLLTAHPCQALSFLGGVAELQLWPLGHRLVRLCDTACAQILFPVSAAALDERPRFGERGERAEHHVAIRLLAVARAAQANKIVKRNFAALALCDNMATLVRVPRSASGAAIEAGEHGGFDGGGDGGFLGHGAGPFVGYPYYIARFAGACKGNLCKAFESFLLRIARAGRIKNHREGKDAKPHASKGSRHDHHHPCRLHRSDHRRRRCFCRQGN